MLKLCSASMSSDRLHRTDSLPGYGFRLAIGSQEIAGLGRALNERYSDTAEHPAMMGEGDLPYICSGGGIKVPYSSCPTDTRMEKGYPA